MSQGFNCTAAEIIKEFSPLISEVIGNPDARINKISAVEDGGSGSLVFVDKKEFVQICLDKKPSAVVTSTALKDYFSKANDIVVFISPNVSLAHAKVKGRYGDRDYDELGWPKVHPSAVIHGTAQIDGDVVIEPHVVISKNVVIGKNSRIMAGSVIENDVVVGHDTIIRPSVVIGYKCQIGNFVDIGSGSVIGSSGYGFAQDEKRKSHPIPQTGIVVIEDRVRVGANCCIDRAAYKTTRIGAGTKLDNLCHVAHNVQIGEDCLLASMLCVAGSSTIGDRVITSGQTGILDHVTVCNDAVLLHRAGVAKDLDVPGVYAGLPLQPLTDYFKNMAIFRNLTELRKKISALEKRNE